MRNGVLYWVYWWNWIELFEAKPIFIDVFGYVTEGLSPNSLSFASKIGNELKIDKFIFIGWQTNNLLLKFAVPIPKTQKTHQ